MISDSKRNFKLKIHCKIHDNSAAKVRILCVREMVNKLQSSISSYHRLLNTQPYSGTKGQHMRFLDYKKTEVKIIHIQTCVRLAHTLRLKNPEAVRAQADAEGRTESFRAT